MTQDAIGGRTIDSTETENTRISKNLNPKFLEYPSTVNNHFNDAKYAS